MLSKTSFKNNLSKSFIKLLLSKLMCPPMCLRKNSFIIELHSLYLCSVAVNEGRGSILEFKLIMLWFSELDNAVNKKPAWINSQHKQVFPSNTAAPNTWSYMIKKKQCRDRYRELQQSSFSYQLVKSNPRGSVLDRNMRHNHHIPSAYAPHLPMPVSYSFLHVYKSTPAIIQTSTVGIGISNISRSPPAEKLNRSGTACKQTVRNKNYVLSSSYAGIQMLSEITHLLCRQGLGLKSEYSLPVP